MPYYIKSPEGLTNAKRLSKMAKKVTEKCVILHDANPTRTDVEMNALKSVVEAFEVIEGLLGDVEKLREKTGWEE